MSESIKLRVGGFAIEGWKSLTITESMEQQCAKFDATLFDKQGEASLRVAAGEPILWTLTDADTRLKANLLNGYIDSTRKTITGTGTVLSFTGRDKTADLVDCAAIQKSNVWINTRFSDICKKLASPFSIDIDTSALVDDDKIDRFVLQNGETAFAAIERLCLAKGVLPLHDVNGNLVLTYASSFTRADEDLELGVNMLDLDIAEDISQRYSVYIVKGQGTGKGRTWTKENTRLFASAEDVEVPRYRPHLFMSENRATAKNLIRRVNWEAQVRAGRGLEYNVTVKDWFQRDTAGKKTRPWTVNERVNVKVSRYTIKREMLITGVTRSLNESRGRITKLVLKHPDTYAPNPTQKVKLR